MAVPIPAGLGGRRTVVLGAVLAAAGALIGVVVVLHVWKGIDYGYLTRDPAATVHEAPYLGLLSQVGICLWAAAAALCFAKRAALPAAPVHAAFRAFLLASAILSVLLAADDAFQLHENLLPRAGVPEGAVIAGWGLAIGGYLLRHQATIRRTDPAAFLLALAALALSAGIDQLVARPDDLQLAEEGAKLVGIVSWTAYFATVRVSPPPPSPPRAA